MGGQRAAIIAILVSLIALTGGCFSASGESSSPAEGYFIVTLSVSADSLLDNLHLLNREKHELIPADGVIFQASYVKAWEGDSVFDLLHREMRQSGIHMAFRNTPLLDSSYVEAINNIYEFDAGDLSGWMFQVNGIFPGLGASQHLLNPGDSIEWIYTLDLGRDIVGYEPW